MDHIHCFPCTCAGSWVRRVQYQALNVALFYGCKDPKQQAHLLSHSIHPDAHFKVSALVLLLTCLIHTLSL